MTRDEDAHLIAIMMRDQTTIEQLAVSAVTTAITKCPHLSCEISSNDKTPSWDGYIYVHKNERKDKQGLNRVAVQVKGKECVSFSPDSITDSRTEKQKLLDECLNSFLEDNKEKIDIQLLKNNPQQFYDYNEFKIVALSKQILSKTQRNISKKGIVMYLKDYVEEHGLPPAHEKT